MNAYYRGSLKKSSACLKVFIIDAVPMMRQGLVHLINDETDLSVCGEADNASVALRSIGEHQPDIIITGLSCGNGNGLSFIEDMAIRFAGIPILVFSKHDETIFAERCLIAGAKGYVMKIESPEMIMLAMRKILKGGIFVSAQAENKLLSKFYGNKHKDMTSPIESLSNRELEVFQFIGQGLRSKQIAVHLNISPKTIGTHIDRIKKKMALGSTREVFMNAFQWITDTNTEQVQVSK